MAAPTEFIEINNFTPGIFADYHHGDGITPTETNDGNILVPGAAVIDDTYRCCADRSGALVPLPKLRKGRVSAVLPTADNDAAHFPTGHLANYLMDGYVRGDMFVYDDLAPETPDRAGVYTMYGFPYKVAGDANFQWTMIAQLTREFDASGFHDLMWARSAESLDALSAANMQLGSGNFIPFRTRPAMTEPTLECVVWVAAPSPGYNNNYGLLKTGTIPAGELSLTTFDAYTDSIYPGAYQRVIGIHPNPGNPAGAMSQFLDSTHGAVGGMLFDYAVHLVGHQGRMVALTREPKPAGAALITDNWGIISEQVKYGPVQDFFGQLGFSCFETAQWGEEKPYRSGVVASITADEILFIRDRGGAILVRGDLDAPTVVQLPYVESTHGARSIPAHTNFGLVYGTSNGVYVWEGGETSRMISDQLEGWFWNHDPALNYLGNRGRFGWWNPWVCAPNNFLYDSRSKSWWRLDSPANTGVSLSAYDVSDQTNTLYAFPHKLSAANDTMWWKADPQTLADTYSWRSQPIVQPRDRMMTVQEVHLLVSPASTAKATVKITLTGIGQDGTAVTPVAVNFECKANTNPQMLKRDVAMNFHATHVQVLIETNSKNTSVPAPKIHSVRLGVGSRSRIPRAGAPTT